MITPCAPGMWPQNNALVKQVSRPSCNDLSFGLKYFCVYRNVLLEGKTSATMQYPPTDRVAQGDEQSYAFLGFPGIARELMV